MGNYKFPLFVFCLFAFIMTLAVGVSFPVFSFIALAPTSHFILHGVAEEERTLALGALLAIGPLVSFFLAPIAGNLADEKGRKPVIIAAITIMLVGNICTALGVGLESLTLIVLSRIAGGLGSSGFSALVAAIADISTPERKAKNFAWWTTASSLGFMIGPFIGGKLAQGGHYAYPFILVACLTFLNWCLLFFCFKDSFTKKKAPEKVKLFKHLEMILKNKKIRLLLFSAPLFSIGFVVYWQFISVNWIEQYKLNEKQVGNMYTYGAAWFALSSALLIRPLLNRFRNLSLMAIASFSLGIVTLLIAFRTGMGMFWLCIPLQEFFLALLGPTSMAFISNGVKEADQGKTMGIAQALSGISFAISPLLGGFIAGINYNAHIFFGGCLVLLFTAVMVIGYRKEIFQRGSA